MKTAKEIRGPMAGLIVLAIFTIIGISNISRDPIQQTSVHDLGTSIQPVWTSLNLALDAAMVYVLPYGLLIVVGLGLLWVAIRVVRHAWRG